MMRGATTRGPRFRHAVITLMMTALIGLVSLAATLAWADNTGRVEVYFNNKPVPSSALDSGAKPNYISLDYVLQLLPAELGVKVTRTELSYNGKSFTQFASFSNRIFVPIKAFVEFLGGEYTYNPATEIIDIYTFTPKTLPTPEATGSVVIIPQNLMPSKGDVVIAFGEVEINRSADGSIMEAKTTVMNNGIAPAWNLKITCFFENPNNVVLTKDSIAINELPSGGKKTITFSGTVNDPNLLIYYTAEGLIMTPVSTRFEYTFGK